MTLGKRPNFRHGYKSPKWDQDPEGGLKYLAIVALIVFCLLIGLIGWCAVPVKSQDGVVVHVKNFGKAMTPGLPPYRNDPEGIVLSQNMYSLMVGGRELRSGYSELVPYDTINNTVTAPIDAFTTFSPLGDSSAIVFAAGGHWYTFTSGYTLFGGRYGQQDFSTPDNILEIRPYVIGTISVDTTTLQVLGVGTRFVRDLQVGDSIFSSDTTNRYKITYIVDDTVLYIDTTAAEDSTISDSYVTHRGYTDNEGVKPYLHSSKGLLYTGTQLDANQVIYKADSNLFLRELGIVDSFLIDTVYTLYPYRNDSTGNDPEDTARWDSTSVYPRRSWGRTNFTAGGYSSIWSWEFQLVNRRKAWVRDQWVTSVDDNAETYYLRMGRAARDSSGGNTGSFFQIIGNDDTAIFLSAWYVDSAEITRGTSKDWNDSIFYGRGVSMVDTIDAADVEGRWAYIYSSAGFQNIVVPDSATNKITMKARGSMFYTIDASFPIDTTETSKNIMFIHLTGDDLNFPAYSSDLRTSNRYTIRKNAVAPAPTLPIGDTLLSQKSFWFCGLFWNGSQTVYYTEKEARDQCGEDNGHSLGTEYTIATLNTRPFTLEREAISNGYFPIRYMRQGGLDSIFFITNIDRGSDLTDPQSDTTSNWEIVSIGMPNWAGMTEWGSPPQLVAWGDTLASGIISFSGPNDHWNWSSTNDLVIGNDPQKPVVGVAGFDDHLVAFQPSEMSAFNGNSLIQISASDGLVSPHTIVKREKEMYWADVDGPKRIKLQDFRGYSIEKLGQGMDPVFNAWNATAYGSDMVPVAINPTYRYKSLMAYNKRDDHLYYAFTSATKTENDKIATFDIKNNQWDGIFTIPTSTIGSYNINDTLRLIFTDDDSSKIFKLDYAWVDNGVGIDGRLLSSSFYLTDEKGFPVKSKIGLIQLVYRGSAAIDTLYVKVVGDNATTTITPLEYLAAAFQTFTSTLRPSTENVSMFWQWDMNVSGSDSGGAYIPYDLYIELLPVERNN